MVFERVYEVGSAMDRKYAKLLHECPFCKGNRGEILKDQYNDYYGHCVLCGAFGTGKETKTKAVKAWNGDA